MRACTVHARIAGDLPVAHEASVTSHTSGKTMEVPYIRYPYTHVILARVACGSSIPIHSLPASIAIFGKNV